jgi:hypothetical protein
VRLTADVAKTPSMESGMRRPGRLALTTALALLLAAALAPASASAFTGYGYVGEFGESGPGPGQFLTSDVPHHLAVNQETGYAYAADSGNNRIDVFKPSAAGACGTACATPIGEFGGAVSNFRPVGLAIDPASGDVYATSREIPAVNEEQEVTVSAEGGTFKLSFEGQETAAIAYNALEFEVQEALEALSTIGAFNVHVTGEIPGSLTVEFQEALAGANLEELACDGTALTGTGPGCTVATTRDGVARTPGKLVKFIPSENPPTEATTYTQASGLEFTPPAEGGGAEEVGGYGHAGFTTASDGPGIAVDPTTGDLLIADYANARVDRIASDGAWLGSFDGTGGGGTAFAEPWDLAVNSAGDAIVADELPTSPSTARVTRYNAAGELQATLVTTGSANGIAVAANPLTDEVFVASRGAIFASPKLEEFREDVKVAELAPNEASKIGGNEIGLAVRGSASGRLYLLATSSFETGNVPRVQVWEAGSVLLPPAVTIAAPLGPGCLTGTEPTGTEACFSGTVDPNGAETHWRFEYRKLGAATWTKAPVPDGDAGAGGTAEEVEVTVSELEPETEYEVRLSATNPVETALSAEPNPTFTTKAIPPAPPTLSEERAWSVSDTVAALAAKLDIHFNSELLECRFEWGTTAAYGHSAPCYFANGAGELTEDLGEFPADGEAHYVDAKLSELSPQTPYHFRLLAANGTGGPQQGEDATFTTYPTVVFPQRGDELVTPPDKNGQSVGPEELKATHMAPDGRHLTYETSTLGSFGDVPNGLGDAWLATRASGGWESTYAGLPTSENPNLDEAATSGSVNGASTDLSTLIYTTGAEVDPNDRNGSFDVYARNPDGSFSWISQGNGGLETARVPSDFMGASADAAHVLFETAQALTPSDSAQVAGQALYERAGGVTTLVGVKTDGSLTSTCGAVAGVGDADNGHTIDRAISAAGSRVFFESPDPEGEGDAGCSPARGGTKPVELYLRENGATTTEVSLSQQTGSAGTPAPSGVEYVGASAEGSRVFFTSPDQLTDDAAAASGGLYVYDVDSASLTFIARGRPLVAEGNPAISTDGSHVYFVGEAPGGPTGEAGLYLWDEGQIAYISPPPSTGFTAASAEASAHGSTLAFTSASRLTGFDGHGKQEVYVYSATDTSLLCASCDPDGVAPSGDATLAWQSIGLSNSNRAVTADGSGVFFSSPSPLLPQATNGLRNVYEYRDGQLSLISDGNGPFQAVLVGASADGNDVIVSTGDSLVPQDTDHGGGDLYDVRVGGGFPYNPPTICEGEDCRPGASPPPAAESAGSASFTGPGNVTEGRKPRPHCPKGKRKVRRHGKARCVRKQHRHRRHHRHAGASRRTGR